MVKVILQPTGKFYYDAEGLKGNFNIAEKKDFLDKAQLIELNKLYKDGEASYWSNTSCPKNKNTWEQINQKDLVLFSNHGIIFASAVVTYKMKNKNLGKELDSKDREGNIYELFYFFDNVQKRDIPYKNFNKIVGYKPTYPIRNFVIQSEGISARIMRVFNIKNDPYYKDITEEDYVKAIREFDPKKPLDTEGKALFRKEQNFLRQFLFANNKISICGICGKEFPVELLVAAHIKRRSICAIDEKLDYKNIVMPMCKLGCDALYENGYITIIDGKIVTCKSESHIQALNDYIGYLNDRSCTYWNMNSLKYFKWHNKFVFKNSMK